MTIITLLFLSTKLQIDEWFHVVPEGLLDFLKYTMKKYKNPQIYVTENG